MGCQARVASLVTAPLLPKGRKAGKTTTCFYAFLGAGDLSRARAERPDCLCLGTLGEAGLNQLQGAGTRNLAWLRRS